MAKTPTRTAAAPFAHLLSLVTGKSPKAADDEQKPDAEEEEGEEEAEDEKPEEGAEDDKPSEDADEGEDDKKDAKGGKRASRRAEKDEDEEAEGKAESDDDDEEMAQARREGFLAAQARGRRIFGVASAGKRPDMAAHLAFNDEMPSAQAVAMLDMAASGAVSADAGSRLGRRMARVVLPNPGASSGGKKPEEMSFGDMAKAAAKKAGIL